MRVRADGLLRVALILVAVMYACGFGLSSVTLSKAGRYMPGAAGGEENGETDEKSQELFEDEEAIGRLDELLGTRTDIGFSELYGLIKDGDVQGVVSALLETLADSLVYELRTGRLLAARAIAVIILGSLFSQVSSGAGGYVTESSFLVTYMVLMTLMLGCFVVAQTVVTDTLENVMEFVEVFYPMYAASIVYVQGPDSAYYSQTIIVLVMYICQNIILGILLPLIKCSGILSLVNSLNREDYFSKMSDLMRGLVTWGLKAMFAVITGINVIKCMLAPSMDRISRNGILRSLGRVSGMASVSAACSVIISTGEFIKSCMGATCTVVLITLSVVPMLKLLVMVFMLKCIAAVTQPASDRRYANGVSAVALAVELMLKACGISVMMFVLSIALMTMNLGG